jgi:hypothetical protein
MTALAIGGTSDHCLRFVVSSCDDGLRESGAIDKRRIVKVDRRKFPLAPKRLRGGMVMALSA